MTGSTPKYMDLLKLKQGTQKHMNKGNVRRNAKRKDIKNPASLMVEEIQDALRYCRIRASDLRKQAKSLRKAHLRNCLVAAQEKGDKERARAVKQKMDREENVKMWTNIKYVVKYPRSSQALKFKDWSTILCVNALTKKT